MHAVIRSYTGASALVDEMQKRSADVKDVIGAVDGFQAYYAVRQGDALTTVTVCDDRAGTDASTKAAADWVRANLPGVSIGAPKVTEGDVFVHLNG